MSDVVVKFRPDNTGRLIRLGDLESIRAIENREYLWWDGRSEPRAISEVEAKILADEGRADELKSWSEFVKAWFDQISGWANHVGS